jgi:multiple sugar transport system substrate-binding protein
LKTLRALLATAVAVTGLAAGSASAADATFMTFSYAEETNKPLVEKVLTGFNAETQLSVEPLGFAWGDIQKNLFLRARSNDLPDVAQISERWLPTLAALPGAVDFNTVYGADELSKIFAADALAMGQINGKQMGLPWISGSIGMVANKAVLDAAGIAAVPSTLAEFKEALVAIRDSVPNSVPYTMATKGNGSILLDFMIWTWVHGGSIIDASGEVKVDSAESRAALGFMVELMNERLAAPEIDRPDARRLVGQGASGFYFDAPQTRTFLRDFSGQGEAFDVNVLPMQTPVLAEGNEPVSIQWGHLLMAFADGATTRADSPAARFLSYATGDAVQSDFPLKLSALPSTQSGRAAASGDAYLANWAAATGVSRTNEVGVWPNGADLTNIIGEEVQAALLGQKSADDAITAMSARLKESMANAVPAS